MHEMQTIFSGLIRLPATCIKDETLWNGILINLTLPHQRWPSPPGRASSSSSLLHIVLAAGDARWAQTTPPGFIHAGYLLFLVYNAFYLVGVHIELHLVNSPFAAEKNRLANELWGKPHFWFPSPIQRLSNITPRVCSVYSYSGPI